MHILRTAGLKQLFLLSLIILLGITLFLNLYYFLPGVLGAITLYIVARQFFFRLTKKRKWKKWLAALFIIFITVVVFLIPVAIIIQLLIPQFSYAFSHSGELMERGEQFITMLKSYLPQLNIDQESVQRVLQQVAMVVPSLLNATLSLLINILTALFLVYFMFVGSDEMEAQIVRLMPINDMSQDELWVETKNMVVSNAIGIPVLILCQCAVAILGYLIFGVNQAIVWGVITGVASIIPVVGTMVVWIPICVVMFAMGDVGLSIGLFLYCAIVVSNIDNVLRFSIMKRIGDVHPLITVFGVIVGLNLFGLMGLIFGPLLITYFLLLIKIYRAEYKSKEESIISP